jgi:ATP-dependent Lon protease
VRALKEADRLSQMPAMSPEVGIIRTCRLDPGVTLTEATKTTWMYAMPVKSRSISLWVATDQRPYSGIYCCAQPASETHTPADPVFCWPARHRQNLARQVDRRSPGTQICAPVLGASGTKRDSRPPPDLYWGVAGRILQTMRRAGTINPLFMLDEVDKLGQDFRETLLRPC